MKNLKRFTAILLLTLPLFFTSCTPDLDYDQTTREIISQGKWTVGYYFASQDKTSQFASYEFSFLGNGTVEVSGNGHNFTGTWNVIRDVERKDVLKMVIESQEPDLAELNEQWSVTDKGSNFVAMNSTNAQFRLKRQ
jgi:succinate dehydrogenase hydrophobic anchor subunit